MTIKDLAAQTGYSVGTISRVLNNHPNVSEKARTAILQAVEESGFRLNVNAKQLKQQHTTTVLLIVRGSSNELFQELVEAIQTRMAQTSYSLVVDFLDENSNEVHRALQLCPEKKPLGILFLGGHPEHFRADFHKIAIPCVLVTNDASSLPFENLSSVCIDDREAARSAIDTLVRLGHRRIAVIGGDRVASHTGRLRYEGCLRSFREHGIPFDDELDYQDVRFSYQEGYRATRSLLQRHRSFTAIFAAGDVLAIGAIRALGDSGLRVPEDVSVLGLDGLNLGEFLMPRLATISQDLDTMARRSVEILLDAMENGGKARHETVPFAFMRKESICRIGE